jgi:hypothetical protein
MIHPSISSCHICLMTSQNKTIASSQTLVKSSAQPVSPALARDFEDCRKTSLNLVSVHASESSMLLTLPLLLIAHGISSVSLILIE